MDEKSLALALNNPYFIPHGNNWIGLYQNQFPASICNFTSKKYGVRAFLIMFCTLVKSYDVKSVRQFVAHSVSKFHYKGDKDVLSASILNSWRLINYDVDARTDVFDESWFKLSHSCNPFADDKFNLFYHFCYVVGVQFSGFHLSKDFY